MCFHSLVQFAGRVKRPLFCLCVKRRGRYRPSATSVVPMPVSAYRLRADLHTSFGEVALHRCPRRSLVAHRADEAVVLGQFGTAGRMRRHLGFQFLQNLLLQFRFHGRWMPIGKQLLVCCFCAPIILSDRWRHIGNNVAFALERNGRSCASERCLTELLGHLTRH